MYDFQGHQGSACKRIASHRTFGRSPHALAARCVAGLTRSSGAPVLAVGVAATRAALGGLPSAGERATSRPRQPEGDSSYRHSSKVRH